MRTHALACACLLPLSVGLLAVGGCSSDGSSDSAAAPLPPSEVKVDVVSARNVRLSWKAQPGEMRIERKTEGGTYQEVARKPGPHARHLELGLLPQTAYQYRVSQCSGAQCSPAVELTPVTTFATELPDFQLTVPMQKPSDSVVVFGIFKPLPTSALEGHAAAVDRDGTILWEFATHERGPFTEIEPLSDHTLATGQFMNLVVQDLDGTQPFVFKDAKVHHDIDILPDGRFIFLTFEVFEKEAGYKVLGDGIEILNLDKKAVDWKWLGRDHIPETDLDEEDMKDVVFQQGHDWTHANAIIFNEKTSKIYLNIRNLNRLYKIDYPSGNVDWIMGQGGDFGEGLWYHSHNPHFTADNRFLMLDNGLHRPGEQEFSRVIEVEFDEVKKTAQIVWEYRETPDFYTFAQGSVEQEPNGQILVTDGWNARIFELTRDKQKVWELRGPATGYTIYKSVAVPKTFFTEW